MEKYLAKYTVRASMFDGGAFMPDPEPHKLEYLFEAKDETDAKKLAEEHRTTFNSRYFSPTSTLDQLLKVENVQLEK